MRKPLEVVYIVYCAHQREAGVIAEDWHNKLSSNDPLIDIIHENGSDIRHNELSIKVMTSDYSRNISPRLSKALISTIKNMSTPKCLDALERVYTFLRLKEHNKTHIVPLPSKKDEALQLIAELTNEFDIEETNGGYNAKISNLKIFIETPFIEVLTRRMPPSPEARQWITDFMHKHNLDTDKIRSLRDALNTYEYYMWQGFDCNQ